MEFIEEKRKQNEINQNEKRKKFSKEPVIALGFIFFLLLGFTAGYFIRPATATTSSGLNLSNFERVYNTISENYAFLDELDESLETLAIRGFINELGDIHTSYMTQEEYLSFYGSMDNNYSGIGVLVSKRNNDIYIKMVVAGSPAETAGLKNGDKIVSVDGVSASGKTTTELAEVVRGETGTIVSIVVERENEQLSFKVERQPLDSSVMYEIRSDGDVKFGYLYITTFGTTSATYVEKALSYFKENNIDRIVIDLRDNTGGYLTTVHGILELFFNNNEILFQTAYPNGEIESYKAVDKNKYSFSMGYILINGNTASASEVMAGALSELLGYELIGTTTYGKGTAQTSVTLSDLSTFKYTYSKWLLPSGNNINGIGLKPDYEVENIDLNTYAVLEIEEALVYDSVSSEAAYMQRMLQEIGYQIDRTDGYFNSTTEEALKAFEKDYGLTVDGKYSSEDNEVLINALVSFAGLDENDYQYHKVLEIMK